MSEIKMNEIAKMIKEQTGQSTRVGKVKDVAEQMNEIEIINIGKAKGIRKKLQEHCLINKPTHLMAHFQRAIKPIYDKIDDN